MLSASFAPDALIEPLFTRVPASVRVPAFVSERPAPKVTPPASTQDAPDTTVPALKFTKAALVPVNVPVTAAERNASVFVPPPPSTRPWMFGPPPALNCSRSLPPAKLTAVPDEPMMVPLSVSVSL